MGNVWVFFNVARPPFDQKKVRQAIAYAIDKKELIKAASWGLGEEVNNQPFLNRSRMYIPVPERAYDAAKARELLAEAGYGKGFKVEFFQTSGGGELSAAEVVAGQLKKDRDRGHDQDPRPGTLV